MYEEIPGEIHLEQQNPKGKKLCEGMKKMLL
jgi:hypothetical protein